jgi:hypothetical protein
MHKEKEAPILPVPQRGKFPNSFMEKRAQKIFRSLNFKFSIFTA